jgi:hypothetical protein
MARQHIGRRKATTEELKIIPQRRAGLMAWRETARRKIAYSKAESENRIIENEEKIE